MARINYYKLSAYWKPFQDANNNFLPNTTFNKIIDKYNFDSILKNILSEAIAYIETSLKTVFANTLSKDIDPFFYTNISNYANIKQSEFDEIIQRIKNEYDRSKEPFITHFKNKYGDKHNLPPVWCIVEIISFGTFAKIEHNLKAQYIKKISKHYNINYKVLKSWLWSINEVRNICAHHSRLWNKELGNKPALPNNGLLSKLNNNRVFIVICIFLWLDTNKTIKSDWYNRLLDLLKKYPNIPLTPMGFPEDWPTIFDNIIKEKNGPSLS